MPIAKITGQGLAGIALSVGLLWGCVVVEQVKHRDAVSERARVVREVRQMRLQRSEPVAAPSPFTRKRMRVTAG